MKVTFKSITQEAFELDIDPSLTVLDVKKAIASSRGEDKFPADQQKLIYNGKILEDEQIFESVNFDEKRFIVVVLKRAVTKPAESTPAPKKEETPAETPKQEAPLPAKAATQEPATPANRAPPLTTPQAPARSSALSEEHQEKLNNIVAMGYPESEALTALRAAFFDPERAVEYLINGVPDTVRPEGGYDVAMEGGDDDEGEHIGLEFLQDNEQFQQLRDMLRNNPEMLPEIMQQIAQDNPALMQLIRENEDQFLNLLNEDAAAAEDAPVAGGGGVPAGGQPQGLPPNVIAITQADRDAINRLKEMGFPEQLVIEAYFACDKNEGLAVNYILSRMEDADDDEGEAQS